MRLLIRKANVPWLGCGVADLGLAEQGFHGLGLVLTAPQVCGGGGGEVGRAGRIRLRHMAFDVAVEQFYGIQLRTVAGQEV